MKVDETPAFGCGDIALWNNHDALKFGCNQNYSAENYS